MEGTDSNKTFQFYTVQEVERTNLGHRTYSDRTTAVHTFEENEVKEALKIFKKSVHNDICFNKVTYIDQAPYYIHELVWGERITMYDQNKQRHTCVQFKSKSGSTDFIIPFSSRVSVDDLMDFDSAFFGRRKRA